MPLYFVDTDDNGAELKDTNGYDLPDKERARTFELRAMTDLFKDATPDGDLRTFRVAVKDEQRRMVYSVTVTLQGSYDSLAD